MEYFSRSKFIPKKLTVIPVVSGAILDMIASQLTMVYAMRHRVKTGRGISLNHRPWPLRPESERWRVKSMQDLVQKYDKSTREEFPWYPQFPIKSGISLALTALFWIVRKKTHQSLWSRSRDRKGSDEVLSITMKPRFARKTREHFEMGLRYRFDFDTTSAWGGPWETLLSQYRVPSCPTTATGYRTPWKHAIPSISLLCVGHSCPLK